MPKQKRAVRKKKSVIYKKKNWSVYIVRCADGTLYTGISNDVAKRLEKHNTGKGARYMVPGRRPVMLVHEEGVFSYGKALKRERAIKKSGTKAKREMIEKKQ